MLDMDKVTGKVFIVKGVTNGDKEVMLAIFDAEAKAEEWVKEWQRVSQRCNTGLICVHIESWQVH